MVQEQAELSVCAVRGTHMVILIIPLGKSFKECSSLSFLKSGVIPGYMMRKT